MVSFDGFLEQEEGGFRPKIGGRVRAEKTSAVSALRKIRPLGVRKGYYPSIRATPKTHEFSRRVLVKARIVKMSKNGWDASQAHLKYIEREGVDKDGSKGKMFGDEQSFKRDSVFEKLPDEKRQFRFIVSPEDADKIDLKKFTQDLMKDVEYDLGRELHWGAVAHYNTDNPHVHIVVRGIDKNGHEVRIDPQYISHGIRGRAAGVVEREIGLRSRIDLEVQLDSEISQSRVTGLDKKIEKFQNAGVVDLGGDNVPSYSRDRLHERMKYLSGLGLADHKGGYRWEVVENWQEELKILKIQNDKFKAINEANLEVQHKRIFEKGIVSGKVSDIGLSNELYDRFYLVVETTKGEAYYVDISQRDYERNSIRKGDIITVKSNVESWGKRSDGKILEIAAGNEGVYDSSIHRASIAGDTVTVDKMTIDADDYVEAHKKRLGNLVRYGFATQLSDTTWAVDPSMRERLAEMDREGPKIVRQVGKESGLTIQDQVTYRGNTWLDNHLGDDAQKGLSRFGFGQEARDAIRRRALFLRQELGIDSADQWRIKKLTDIEKNDHAAAIHKKTGFKHREAANGEGKLSDSGALASGRRYAVIMNEKTREFSMVPWKKQYEQLQGKQVQIERAGQGRWMVRQLNRTRGIGL